MVSKELEQLLNGKSSFSRELAPEPLLLPRIASRITPEGLRFTVSATDALSSIWAPYGWSALADATAQAIASRHMDLSDNLLHELCDKLPQLLIALIELDDEAGERADTIIGIDAANLLREGLGDSIFYLREAVSRVFSEPDPPRTEYELMAFIRDRTELESPAMQRNLLAYFLPLVPVEHHRWMIPILINVLGVYPGWGAAAAASRVAGFLDHAAAEQVVATLWKTESSWVNHVRELLASDPAGSEFDEIVRALPDDDLFTNLLARETELDSLDGVVDAIMNGWAGAPPQMAASRGMEPFEMGEDAGEEEAGPEEELPEFLPRSPLPQEAPVSVFERRLQAQVFADDDGVLIPVRQGFMKDTRHDVRLWIGPQTKHSINADVAITEPTPDAQELKTGSMEIVITLVYDSKPQIREVELPVDRTKRSKAAVFSLDVDKDSQFVSAEIWLQHKGRVFQYLKLNGLSLEEPDSTTDGIALDVETLIRALPEDASGSNFEMAMVKKDNKYIVFGPRGVEKTEVSLQGAHEAVEKINKTLFNTTKGLVRHSADQRGTSWVGDHDEEAMKLLCFMARWGNLLYQHLKKEGVLERISETIQFINLDETDIVPVEYVYDKGYPKDGATLCDGFRDSEDWNEIFASGQCSCSNQPLVESDTLCPMGFWSLSKIIERQSRPRGAESTSGFIAPSGESTAISLGRQAVLAAAPNVNGLDVDSIKVMLDETYPNRYTHATNWQEWETEIKEKSPKLLVLLPHHGEATQGHTDFLEIGSPGEAQGDKLRAGNLSDSYVTSNSNEPGPVVLLLGCETAQSDLLPFHTFARDFLANSASIVVATQASVLGQHAAPVANEFIRQLLASTHVDGSFGKIMRDVRQKMFSEGYLMSLALVSFGDSDWKLGSIVTGDNHVPN